MDTDLQRTIAETTRMIAETTRINAERDLLAAQRRVKLGRWVGLVEFGVPMIAGAGTVGLGIVVAWAVAKLMH